MPDDIATTQSLPPLAPRARAVLTAIVDLTHQKGYPPSMREIGDAVGLKSLNSVSFQLASLVRKGYIRRDPNQSRAIVVIEPEERA